MTISFNGSSGLVCLPGNAQAIGSRHEQQDSFGFSDPQDRVFLAHGGLLAVVADGMGGMEHGGEASRIAVRAFLEAYGAKTPDESVKRALYRAIETSDRAVFDFAASASLERDVGSTLVAAVFIDDGLQWISAGDSALYLRRAPDLTLMTHPHTLGSRLEKLVASGQLSVEAARIDPDRDALTSYIGAGGLPEIDASAAPSPLVAGDCVLLCSDGLYRALSAEDIGDTLDRARTGQDASESLVERAISRNLPHQDNITALCIVIAQADSPAR